MEATHLFLLQLEHLLMLPLDHLGFLLLQVFRGREGGREGQSGGVTHCTVSVCAHGVNMWCGVGAVDNDSSL